MWREFKIPYGLITQQLGIKVPRDTSSFIPLTKEDIEGKYFQIVECIGEYRNGLKTGVWIEYYIDGEVKRKVEYREGVPAGECKDYIGNGTMAEYTISSDDSVLIKIYEINGDFSGEGKVPKPQLIRSIYQD